MKAVKITFENGDVLEYKSIKDLSFCFIDFIGQTSSGCCEVFLQEGYHCSSQEIVDAHDESDIATSHIFSDTHRVEIFEIN